MAASEVIVMTISGAVSDKIAVKMICYVQPLLFIQAAYRFVSCKTSSYPCGRRAVNDLVLRYIYRYSIVYGTRDR